MFLFLVLFVCFVVRVDFIVIKTTRMLKVTAQAAVMDFVFGHVILFPMEHPPL